MKEENALIVYALTACSSSVRITVFRLQRISLISISISRHTNERSKIKMEEEITQAMLDEFENAKGDDEDE